MKTGKERREAILQQIAGCVCKDRMNAYGDAEDNFADIAELWNVQLRAKLSAHLTASDVAAMMIGMKLARIASSPDHLDSWIDAGGYAVCGAGIVQKQNETK